MPESPHEGRRTSSRLGVGIQIHRRRKLNSRTGEEGPGWLCTRRTMEREIAGDGGKERRKGKSKGNFHNMPPRHADGKNRPRNQTGHRETRADFLGSNSRRSGKGGKEMGGNISRANDTTQEVARTWGKEGSRLDTYRQEMRQKPGTICVGLFGRGSRPVKEGKPDSVWIAAGSGAVQKKKTKIERWKPTIPDIAPVEGVKW